MVSNMISAGDFIVNSIALKKSELEICAFFGYNLMLFTPFDYLEHMLYISPLFDDDVMVVPIKQNIQGSNTELQNLDFNHQKLISIKISQIAQDISLVVRKGIVCNFSHQSSLAIAFLIVLEARDRSGLDNNTDIVKRLYRLFKIIGMSSVPFDFIQSMLKDNQLKNLFSDCLNVSSCITGSVKPSSGFVSISSSSQSQASQMLNLYPNPLKTHSRVEMKTGTYNPVE